MNFLLDVSKVNLDFKVDLAQFLGDLLFRFLAVCFLAFELSQRNQWLLFEHFDLFDEFQNFLLVSIS